jgi:hypothetical protein
MNDIASALLAIPLLYGGHEAGHEIEADRLQVPMHWEDKTWYAGTDDKKKLAKIAGAGFRGQDQINKAFEGTSIAQALRGISAANKIGYIINPDSGTSKTGDLRTLDKALGKNSARLGLAASSIYDLLRASGEDPNYSVDFWQSMDGAPGLSVTIPWDL